MSGEAHSPGPGEPGAALSRHHDNNFTFLRFLAASMVIVAHAHDLLGVESIQDPLRRLTGHSMGWAGVTMFFVMSGYLIMSSLDRSRDLVRFAKARALRIFPGLIVCMILTIVLLGLVLTTLPAAAFFTDGRTIKYLLGNGSLLSIQHFLPGVFASNPVPHAVNGSLWTLPFEVSCYFMAMALVGTGMLRSERSRAISFALLFVLALAFIFIQPHLGGLPFVERIGVFHGLAICFLFGMAYACFAHRFVLRWWYAPIAGVAAWLLSATPLFVFTMSLALGLFVMWLAFVPSRVLRWLSELPDYSYGIYIYAFPIQQTLMHFAPGLTPWTHTLIAFLLVLIPAGLSWHLVEKPALRLKDRRLPIGLPLRKSLQG